MVVPSTAWFAAPGVFKASPATGVPAKPGMPAPSKSLVTQSAAVSVSCPSGMRDAPPTVRLPSGSRTGAPAYTRSPALVSRTAMLSITAAQGVLSRMPSLLESRSPVAGPV